MRNEFAETFNMYDFKLKEGGKVIGIWYVKHDAGTYNDSLKETCYAEYETETGKELMKKVLIIVNGGIADYVADTEWCKDILKKAGL